MDQRSLLNGKPVAFKAQDFVDADFIEAKKLVYPIFPVGSNGMLFGQTTAGKTQLALSLAAAVIEGSFFLSKYKCRKGRVAFIQVDSPPGEFKERIEKFAKEHSLEDFMIIIRDGPIDLVKEAEKKGPPAEWVQELRDFKPDLVIADTLNKLSMEDEDDRTTPIRIYMAIRKLCDCTPCILMLHHPRKPGFQGEKIDIYAARGSGAWVNDIEFTMELTKTKEGLRFVHFPKTKGTEDQPTLALDFDPVTLLMDIKDEAKSRMYELVASGWTKDKAIRQLESEALCKVTKARQLYDEAKKRLDEAEAAL